MSNDFLQKIEISRVDQDNLTLSIQYDLKNIEQLSEEYTNQRIVWKENELLFLIKNVIKGIVKMENNFCSFPEISQRMIKIFPKDQNFGLRLLNPFLQTDFLLKFISETVQLFSSNQKNVSLLKLNSRKKFLEAKRQDQDYHKLKKLNFEIEQNSKNCVYQLFFSVLCVGLKIKENSFESSEHKFYKLLKESIEQLNVSQQTKTFFEFILIRDDLDSLPTLDDLFQEIIKQREESDGFFGRLNKVENFDFQISLEKFFEPKSAKKDNVEEKHREFKKRLEEFYQMKKQELEESIHQEREQKKEDNEQEQEEQKQENNDLEKTQVENQITEEEDQNISVNEPQDQEDLKIQTPMKENQITIKQVKESIEIKEKKVHFESLKKRTLSNKKKQSNENVFQNLETPLKSSLKNSLKSPLKSSFQSPNFPNKKFDSFAQTPVEKDDDLELIHSKISQLNKKIQECRESIRNGQQPQLETFQSNIQDKITYTQSEYKEEPKKIDVKTLDLVKNLDSEIEDLEIKENPFENHYVQKYQGIVRRIYSEDKNLDQNEAISQPQPRQEISQVVHQPRVIRVVRRELQENIKPQSLVKEKIFKNVSVQVSPQDEQCPVNISRIETEKQRPSLNRFQDELNHSWQNMHSIQTKDFQDNYLNYSRLFEQLLTQNQQKIEKPVEMKEVRKSLKTSLEIGYLKKSQSQQKSRYFSNMYDSLVQNREFVPRTNLRANRAQPEYFA